MIQKFTEGFDCFRELDFSSSQLNNSCHYFSNRTNIKPNQNLRKKNIFEQKKTFRVVNSFNNYVPHLILEKKQIEQKN